MISMNRIKELLASADDNLLARQLERAILDGNVSSLKSTGPIGRLAAIKTYSRRKEIAQDQKSPIMGINQFISGMERFEGENVRLYLVQTECQSDAGNAILQLHSVRNVLKHVSSPKSHRIAYLIRFFRPIQPKEKGSIPKGAS